MKFTVAACLVACIAAASGGPARSAEPAYLGIWKISAAVTAPWADPTQRPDNAEQARLLGKAIVFKAREIGGPPPFACRAPHYKESDYSADMIFQGAFEEMQTKNKSVDPDRLATSLGFMGKNIRTLETGCEMDFHFVDATTAEIGLNDTVYTLKKQ
jgi:hypothetical protein